MTSIWRKVGQATSLRGSEMQDEYPSLLVFGADRLPEVALSACLRNYSVGMAPGSRWRGT